MDNLSSNEGMVKFEKTNCETSNLPSESKQPCSVSLRFFLASVIIVVGVCSAAVAFAPVYTSATSSIQSMTEELRFDSGLRIQKSVSSFFEKPTQFVSALMMAAEVGSLRAGNTASLLQWFTKVTLASGFAVYAGFDDKSFYMSNVPTSADIIPVEVISASDLTADYNYDYNITLLSNASVIPSPAPNTYDPTGRPWYAPLHTRVSWSNVYLDNGGNFSVITTGGPFRDPTTSKVVGAIAMDFPTVAIKDYLSSQKVGKTGKVLLFDRYTRGFLGGNWNMPSVVVDAALNEVRMSTLSDVAANDLLFQRVYTSLSEKAILNCATPCNFKLLDGREEVNAIYVDILAIEDRNGLDMRVMIILRASDFLDMVDHQSKVSIGATAGALVGLLAIAVLLGHFALAPLGVLENRLYLAATLNDNGDSQEESSLFDGMFVEIRNMEKAFALLQSELQRLKSFLGMSVLQHNDDDGDEGSLASSVTTAAADVESTVKNRQRGDSVLQTISPSSTPRDPVALRDLVQKIQSKARCLNTHAGIRSREVTLVVVNLVNFHSLVGSPALCESTHASYVEMVQGLAAANKGVVDTFSGDRVHVSFNASSNVGPHVSRAAAMIHAISLAAAATRKPPSVVPTLSIGTTVRMACASGKALCGNMGSSCVKRFAIIGSVVNQCSVLCQLAKVWNVENLVSPKAMDGMGYDYIVEPAGACPLPSMTAPEASNATKPSPLPSVTPPVIIGKLIGPKVVESDEWMYQLDKSVHPEAEDMTALHEALTYYCSTGWLSNEGLARTRAMMEQVKTSGLIGLSNLSSELERREGRENTATVGPASQFFTSLM